MLSEAVNQPNFPSEILRPGDEFQQTTVWRFFAQAPAQAPAVAQSGAHAAALVPAALACILAAAAAGLW